jgi:transposase-like protein
MLKQAKKFGSPNVIVTDSLPSYIEAIKTTFNDTKHIRVESFCDDISKSFNKTFKSWYKKIKCFKSFESANSLISNFIFYYNFIKSHSSLSNLTPAEVCGINYFHREKINWFVKY